MRSQISFANAFFELASRLPFQPPEAFVTELVRLANRQPDSLLFVGDYYQGSRACLFYDDSSRHADNGAFAIIDSEGFVEEPWPQQAIDDLRQIAQLWSLLPIEDIAP